MSKRAAEASTAKATDEPNKKQKIEVNPPDSKHISPIRSLLSKVTSGRTHAPCADGAAFAYWMQKEFPTLKLQGFTHGVSKIDIKAEVSNQHYLAGDHCPPDEYSIDAKTREKKVSRYVLHEMIQACQSLIVFDHHPSTHDQLEQYKQTFGPLPDKVHVILDTSEKKCASMMLYESLYPDTVPPRWMQVINKFDVGLMHEMSDDDRALHIAVTGGDQNSFGTVEILNERTKLSDDQLIAIGSPIWAERKKQLLYLADEKNGKLTFGTIQNHKCVYVSVEPNQLGLISDLPKFLQQYQDRAEIILARSIKQKILKNVFVPKDSWKDNDTFLEIFGLLGTPFCNVNGVEGIIIRQNLLTTTINVSKPGEGLHLIEHQTKLGEELQRIPYQIVDVPADETEKKEQLDSIVTHFSLRRQINSKTDLNIIASKYPSGGGHKAAAAIQKPGFHQTIE